MKTDDLVLRRGSRTFVTLKRKLSGRGKKYAKLVDECEEASKGSLKALRKKQNSTKPDLPLVGKKKGCKSIMKADKEGECDEITDLAGCAQSWSKKRRCAICEEIERGTYSDNGMSLRHFREFLVTHHLLKDLNLM